MNYREYSPLLNHESSSISVKVDTTPNSSPLPSGGLSATMPGSSAMAPMPGVGYGSNDSGDYMAARLTDEIQSEASVEHQYRDDYKINQSAEYDLSRTNIDVTHNESNDQSVFVMKQSSRSLSLNYKAARQQLLDDVVPREDKGDTSKSDSKALMTLHFVHYNLMNNNYVLQLASFAVVAAFIICFAVVFAVKSRRR